LSPALLAAIAAGAAATLALAGRPARPPAPAAARPEAPAPAADCAPAPAGGALDEPTPWRVTVDRIEDDVAVVELGVGRMVTLPRCRLPRDVREGDVVLLGPEPPRHDPAALRARLRAALARVEALRRRLRAVNGAAQVELTSRGADP
jgi:hypothetical protein